MRVKNIAKGLLAGFHDHKKQQPDIFIFTLPRAGSTLITEILNTDSHSKTVSEPFSLSSDNQKVLHKYFNSEFFSERYIDVNKDDFDKIIDYLKVLSEGRTWNSFYWSDILTKNHSLKTNRTVFKIHKLTYYYDDIMDQFKNDYGLYLLRHPVSHSLSRIRKGWSTYIDNYSNSEKIKVLLTSKAKSLIQEVNASNNDLEKFIVSWCLENLVFIINYQENKLSSNVFPVFYEDVVTDPENAIRNICSKIGMEYNVRMLEILNIPSSGIIHSTNETKNQILSGNKSYLVNRWKDEVDSDFPDRYKFILKTFGIKIYLD
ncbi:sulfotransferase [Saccharicrinis sp. FJH62]|uniref:sulfotransferase n=1 Tax=Saccharicrinis sp. FJH62 TaxID=3344657 RepID=UPI0035D4F464